MHRTIWSTAFLAMSGLISIPAQAQAPANPWPAKVIRIVVPFAAGSFTDTAARVVGAELSAQLGQTVIVENKGGAGSTLGTDTVAKAAPDGYTFLLTDNSFAVSTALYDKLPYSPTKDLVPVSLVADSPAILVGRPNLPNKTLKETMQAAGKTPAKLTFGSGGQGSSAHLAMEAFLTQNNVQMVHVPFKGIAAAIVDVAADRVDLAIGSVGSTSAYIKDGRLLGLAVSGDARQPLFPNVPTFAEAGYPNYKMKYWFGVMAPTGTPVAIVDRMQKEIAKAVTTQKVRDVFSGAGVRPTANSSSAFGAMVREETALWADVIKRADIKIQ
ncbi:MAG: tripartite tricarboxylate transporter substrate binding protein [Pseudomonadota bacterium]